MTPTKTFVMACPVLEELNLGQCLVPATWRVHDMDDDGSASILSCEDHIRLARDWVRQETKGGLAAESPWPKLPAPEPTLFNA
jgi:hypothetical protein